MISSPRCAVGAIVVTDPGVSGAEIASLTVLDRLVISLSRAGLDRIIIVIAATPATPLLARSAALGIKVEWTARIPQMSGPALMSLGNVLAAASDVERLVQKGGRLASADGQPLPVGLVDGVSEDWQARLDKAPVVRAQQLAALVTPQTLHHVERAFWSSLTSSTDGWVDRHFNRPVGQLLSKRLVRTAITPNQVSIVATLAGLGAAGLFAIGTTQTALAGALVLQGSAIVDCIDGDLARALYKQSALGRWLDIVGDQVVHIGVFLGIAAGLWRAGSVAPVLPLGAAAALGVVLSFAVVMRARLKPERRGHGRLQKMIDATTNRDFSVLLILFAFFGVLDWFLWLAAVGSHAFWIAAMTLQWQGNRTAQVHAEPA
jgi:phosphatidylglycerophosphate synthase